MEPPSDDSDEYDYMYAESALGWGGIVIGPDGIGQPTPEPDALAFAVPQWVDIPEHIEDAVSIYLDVMSRPEVAIRKAWPSHKLIPGGLTNVAAARHFSDAVLPQWW